MSGQPDKLHDADHWARLHVASDRSKPVDIADRPRGRGVVFSLWPSRKPKEGGE
jgi:hypothetical protein